MAKIEVLDIYFKSSLRVQALNKQKKVMDDLSC